MEDETSWGTTTRALAEAGGNISTALVLTPGTVIGGRFRIIARIGAGGMGIVYRAHDSKLSRDVAIKVHARDSAAERLEREATAMAQLSHANVVTVYEVGTHEGAVFIAMELVDGETARAWRAHGSRTWRQVVRLYLAAGEGLVALHRAGLVHRDFKPDNVLVGSDGRARVADLGLARSVGTRAPGSGAFDNNLNTGIAGTRAYMSPEQSAGTAVDERTDQYAFAAALSEALRDLRPPRRIRRALARACAADRAARWPTLQALLDRLAADPRPRLVAALAAVVVAGAVTVGVEGAHRRAPCRGGGDRFSRAWRPEIAAHVHDALFATGLPDAALLWTRTQSALDTYERRWIDSYTSACEATRVHRDQSEDLLDRRMACLESRFEETAALTTLLAHADEKTAKKSADAAGAITPVDGCNDIAGLKAIVPVPADPRVRARVAEVRNQIDRARPLDRLARWPESKPVYERALTDARALGYKPLIAQAALALTTPEMQLDLNQEAEANAREAAYAAEASHDDADAAEAWVQLVDIVGYRDARLAEGHELERMAEAAIARLPMPNYALEAEFWKSRGGIVARESKVQEAIDFNERALAIRREHFGADDPHLPMDMFDTAAVMIGQSDINLRYNERALGLTREALVLDERLLGPDHPELALMHAAIANALLWLGRFDEAEASFERSLAIANKTLGPSSDRTAMILEGQAANHDFMGDCSGAIDRMQRSLAIRKGAIGAEHVDTASEEAFMGGFLNHCKRYDEALRYAEASLAVLSKRDPDEDEVRAYMVVGKAQVGLGHRREAIAAFTRALAIADKHPMFPNETAIARFGLARELPPGEHARALQMAQQARAQLVKLPLHFERELAEIDAWLAAHP